MGKIMSPAEAASLIQSGDTVAISGFLGNMLPEELILALEERFLKFAAPENLTILHVAGVGEKNGRGVNHLAHERLVKRVIGGHWAPVPKMAKLAMENKIEAYNLPQGVISHLFRDIAAKKPGTLTRVGLKTFVDPRLEGGKINAMTTEDMVQLVVIDGKEYLLYKSFPIDFALVRGTYCDENGNATFERESVYLETLAMCQAAKNSGGKVILQVEKVVKRDSLNTKLIRLPGIYVDAIVAASPEHHMQTFDRAFDPSFSGDIRTPAGTPQAMALDERKIIARRCAMELKPDMIVNLGVGIPEGISAVAGEEGIGDSICLTVESGPIGGAPAAGLSFGASVNPDCILDEPAQFDFYDGGGLDIAFLGLAQADGEGNVNVSKFGPRFAGCGGFINISQATGKVVFCGAFTAGGMKIAAEDGRLRIINEGAVRKFISDVEQITFSGKHAAAQGQSVLYVTERAVFKLTPNGLILTEIAPGVDLENDVLAHMSFRPSVSDSLKEMDSRIFREGKMGIG
ncbi:MAG: acyl CoA:acetate/3-ketoacid CoA transferase [Oscillospiraceae bacterium]|jgi:propionate CoA-transferase|nr:acyl CoA:acetate/3-ketoacid CoA transferase [Oscillospiraceae bacterium]